MQLYYSFLDDYQLLQFDLTIQKTLISSTRHKRWIYSLRRNHWKPSIREITSLMKLIQNFQSNLEFTIRNTENKRKLF